MLHYPYYWVRSSDGGAILRWNCGWIASVKRDGDAWAVEVRVRRERTGRASSLMRGMYHAERLVLAGIVFGAGQYAAEQNRKLRAEWVGKFRGEVPLFPDSHK